MFRLRFLMMGLLCLATACKPSEPAKEAATGAPAKGELYRSDQGYAVEFPQGWVIKPNEGGVVLALAPDAGASAVVGVTQAEGDSLDRIFVDSAKKMQQELENFKAGKGEDLKIDGLAAKRRVLGYTLEGQNLKGIQYLVRKGEQDFVITFMTKEAIYDQYAPTFDQILKSFKVTK